MERAPNNFEQWTELARQLSDAVDARNDFITKLGGFDDFADVHQYVDGNREKYDALESVANSARDVLEREVADKPALVAHLREIGSVELANRISRMFDV